MNKVLIGCAAALLLTSGCTLNKQVPKATISFNPKTHQIDIASHKDVVMSNIVATITPSNTSLTIGYYQAQSNIEVVKQAVIAQKQAFNAIQDGTDKVLTALSGIAPK
jgi:hypothetical protein